MGAELVKPPEGSLAESRDKAGVYLADGKKLALGYALDLKLGLGVHGFELAVSHCASQLLRDDKDLMVKDLEQTSKIPFTGFLQRRIQANTKVLGLTEDYLERERERYRLQNMPGSTEEYGLAVRQAVQALFVIERAKASLSTKERSQKVDEWGAHWKTQIQRFT